MLFNTLAYAEFFALVFVVSWLLARWKKLRVLFLLLASWTFYATWDWRFLPLLVGSSSIDWLLGRAIGGAATVAARRRWLAATVALNLGVLGVFKYLDFGIQSASAALASLGISVDAHVLGLTLPIGISFFTFESMSYVIDVYRGHIQPHRSYLEYLTFVAFFPHLVAGPIVRPRDLLPQLAGEPRWSPAEASEGVFLVVQGLLKKVALGDYLALNLVDRVFDAPPQYSSLECYAAVVGYAIQIYCDFSGYTDIAIGSALLLGIRLPKNFDAPYKASSVRDFWRRWHISLSTWLRDYLYVSLGGNRLGPARTYFNLLATMLLGGLWHGASWTFVVWGGLHGAALAVDRWWTGRAEELPSRDEAGGSATKAPVPRSTSSWARRALGTFITFHFVCACWIFFRADGFARARSIFVELSQLTTHHQNLPPTVLAALAVGLGTHWAPERWHEGMRRMFSDLPAPAQALVLFALALVLRELGSANAVPFVYFQF